MSENLSQTATTVEKPKTQEKPKNWPSKKEYMPSGEDRDNNEAQTEVK